VELPWVTIGLGIDALIEDILVVCVFVTCAGHPLKAALISQAYQPPDLVNLFGTVITAPDLDVMFQKKRPRFYKRTSSAVWDRSVFFCSSP